MHFLSVLLEKSNYTFSESFPCRAMKKNKVCAINTSIRLHRDYLALVVCYLQSKWSALKEHGILIS